MPATEVNHSIVVPATERADTYHVQVGSSRRLNVRVTDETVWPPNNYGAGPFVEYMAAEGAALFHDATVLDVGSGSGVLGLTARALGARNVYALDLNPAAVANTTTNWHENGLGEGLHPLERNGIVGLAGEIGEHSLDVILANLPTLPLVRAEVNDLRRRTTASQWNQNPSESARHLVDEVLAEGAKLLRPGGTALFLQGSTQDLQQTFATLREQGWTSWEIVHSHQQPIGENYAHYVNAIPGWHEGEGIEALPEPLPTGETHYRTLYVIKATR